MKTIGIVETPNGQSIPLPEEFRFDTDIVSIRRQGQAVILEPVKSDSWPDHFFEKIHINDPKFTRPDQGSAPKIASLD